MDRQECKNLLNDLQKIKLNYYIIFFRSPLTDEVEETHIFTDDKTPMYVGKEWLQQKIDFYKKHRINFAGYINGQMIDAEGFLFN